jgi:hypothetical protein
MKTKLLLVLVSIAAAGLSNSQTLITQTLYFSGVPDFETPLVFSKYVGPVAHIQNVSIAYDFTINGGRFVVDNDADTPATVNVKFGAVLDASSTDVRMLNNLFTEIINEVEATNQATYELSKNYGDNLNDYQSTGPDGAVLVGATVNKTGGGDVNSIFRSQYAGGGTFTVKVKTSQIGSLSYNSGIETATTPVVASGSITVSYLVPEASSAALLGLSALGLAFRRRR